MTTTRRDGRVVALTATPTPQEDAMTHDQAQRKAAQLIERGDAENTTVHKTDTGDYEVIVKRTMGPRVKDSWESEDRR